MSRASTVAELLDADPTRLEAVAQAAGVPSQVLPQHAVEALPCVLTNMTTADLARVRFGESAGAPSLVVKIAQSPRHSPLWEGIPAAFREQAMSELPWRAEADLYASPLASLLPRGMRMPLVYAVDPLDDDRIALWMEDINERSGAWHRDDYRMAARALGRLAGRLPEERIPSEIPVQRRDFRNYFFGRVVHGALPPLRDDATWRHPLVADVVDPVLRHDLEALVGAIPALLDRLDDIPRTLCHGDACPQNLLRPADEPDSIVAIDWTFAGVAALGVDAAQLLAGRAESGELDPAELGILFDEILDAYIAGLTELGSSVDRDSVTFGVAANLVIRSAFTALPVELLDGPRSSELELLFSRRAGYARFLVDLGLRIVPQLRVRN